MVIDMRTRLPYGHIANNAADMLHQARMLRAGAKALEDVVRQLRELNPRELLRADLVE